MDGGMEGRTTVHPSEYPDQNSWDGCGMDGGMEGRTAVRPSGDDFCGWILEGIY